MLYFFVCYNFLSLSCSLFQFIRKICLTKRHIERKKEGGEKEGERERETVSADKI